jgi:hypothetical protein
MKKANLVFISAIILFSLINVSLAQAGHVLAHVLYNDGCPRTMAFVRIYDNAGEFVGLCGLTNETGYCENSFTGLQPFKLYKANATWPDAYTYFEDMNFGTDENGNGVVTIQGPNSPTYPDGTEDCGVEPECEGKRYCVGNPKYIQCNSWDTECDSKKCCQCDGGTELNPTENYDSTQNSDCPFCQQCSALNTCSNASSGTDPKNDCIGNCDNCNGAGNCAAFDSLCTGNCDYCNDGNCAANDTICQAFKCASCTGGGTFFNCTYNSTQNEDCPATSCPDSCDIDTNPFTWDYANDTPNYCQAFNSCTSNSCNYNHACADPFNIDNIFLWESSVRTCNAQCDQNSDCQNYCSVGEIRHYNGACDFISSCTCSWLNQEDCNNYDDDHFVDFHCYASTGDIYNYYQDWGCSAGSCVYTGSNWPKDLKEDCVNTCSDTDSGIDYLNKGTVTDKDLCTDSQTTCPSAQYTDSCNGNNLTEYYCSGNDHSSQTKNCNDDDCSMPIPLTCAGIGTNSIKETGDDYDCSSGACSKIGTKDCNGPWTCSSGSECSSQSCGGSNRYCYYDNGYKWGNSYPTTETNCSDGKDNDCDGKIDSVDPDCFECTPGQARACPLQQGVCSGSYETCTAQGVWPGCSASNYGPYYENPEVSCDNKDNNCDGIVDGMSQSCDSGSCTGSQTCTAGVWGSCSSSGNSCNDGLYCNGADQCNAQGICVNTGPSIDCSSLNDQCNNGICNETQDKCVAQPKPNGTGCDDGLFCTISDACTNGVCGGSARDCTDAYSCTDDSCNETGDKCLNMPNNNKCAFPQVCRPDLFPPPTGCGYSTAPIITIISPASSYYKLNVPLNFTVDRPTNWTGYSLDGAANKTITGNTTLTGLTNGAHTVTVYANDTSGNMGSNTTNFFYCQADIDGNKVVGLSDLVILSKAYGKKCGDTGYDDKLDLNGDCSVSLADLVILSKNYGKVCK